MRLREQELRRVDRQYPPMETNESHAELNPNYNEETLFNTRGGIVIAPNAKRNLQNYSNQPNRRQTGGRRGSVDSLAQAQTQSDQNAPQPVGDPVAMNGL
jgi:hypothetical protein